jgi:hypothetical protein
VIEQDQGRWLTYAEAGELLGISVDAARLRASRQGWSRRTPNEYGATAHVLVPEEAPVRPRPALTPGRPPDDRGTCAPLATPSDQVDETVVRVVDPADMLRMIRGTVAGLVTPLHEQLERERGRADRAEQRVDELQAALAAERQRLIAMLVDRVPWWRRWFR